MILTHPEVGEFYKGRALDPSRWIEGMRRYRQSLMDENGRMSFAKIFGVD